MTTRENPFGLDRDPLLQTRLWNARRATTLGDLIEVPAAMAPDVVAFGLTHHGAADESITWGALWTTSLQRAQQLRDLGIETGTRVMLMLPTCRAFFDIFFGVLLAGAVPVPIAPPPSARRVILGPYLETMKRILGDSEATAAVALGRTLELCGEDLRKGRPSVQLVAADADVPLPPPGDAPTMRPEETALLQYTSGSTSDPKGVELTHGNLIANIDAIVKVISHEHSSGVSWLPFHHDMGLIGMLLGALYARRPAVYMPPQAFIKTPAVWLRTISAIRATITVAPNFAFQYCVNQLSAEDLKGISLDSLELAMNGSEPIDPRAVSAFQERFESLGLRRDIVRPVYGLAESSLAVSFGDPGAAVLDDIDADRLERDGVARRASVGQRSRVFISVGRAIPTQHIRIVDEHDHPMPDRYIGEVVVRGPSVMKGYFRRPVESAEVLRNGWLHTGDLGYQADGQLYITGRIKDLIIRHGKNYYAQDIEGHIADVPDLIRGRVVVFSTEDSSTTRVIVVAETRSRKPEVHAAIERRIREVCQDAFLFGPDEVKLVPPGTIPRTTSGKVRRQACKRWYESLVMPVEGV
jgi:acyl-CoA synthetase (AMP-forming)/AMP-acid ligase II